MSINQVQTIFEDVCMCMQFLYVLCDWACVMGMCDCVCVIGYVCLGMCDWDV